MNEKLVEMLHHFWSAERRALEQDRDHWKLVAEQRGEQVRRLEAELRKAIHGPAPPEEMESEGKLVAGVWVREEVAPLATKRDEGAGEPT
jgi:hypothetical protein